MMEKVKLSLCLINYALRYEGIWELRYSSTILVLGTRWRLVLRFTLLPLYLPGKEPPVPMDRRMVESHSWSGRCGVEKNVLPLPGIEAQPSSPSLYPLSYPGSR
jgi:hypothetical protein